MTKVLAIVNHKGGVAKTTLAKLLCEYAVRQRYRVLGVDIDPQCNFSTRFVKIDRDGHPPKHPEFDPSDPDWGELPYVPTGYWSITEFFKLGYVEPYPTCYENMKIIPADKNSLTSFLEEVDKHQIDEAVINHMKEMFSLEYYQDEFDLIIIDTPPQTSSLTFSAVRAATHLLIPTEMQEDSISGMADMASLWQSENKVRDGVPLKLVGILPVKYDRHSAAQRQTLDTIKKNPVLGDNLIEPPMRYLQTYANSSTSYANPRSLFDIHENNVARSEAELFCEEILKKLI